MQPDGAAARPEPRAFPLLPRRETPAGRLIVRLGALLSRVEPSRRLLRRSPEPPVVVTCVYRRRHADLVLAMMRRSHRARWVLWAYDEVDPRLEHATVGSGRGGRLELHERMVAHATSTGAHQDAQEDAGEDPWWVIADDDIVTGGWSFTELAAVARDAQLDVSAPAHSWGSHWSHRITLQRALSAVRLTHFVEIGPVVVLSPAGRRTLTPFPDANPVGWGLESYWSSLHRSDVRCGLVDALPVDHRVPMGGTYSSRSAWESGQAYVRTLGIDDFTAEQRAMMVTLATWRPWRRRAPWAV